MELEVHILPVSRPGEGVALVLLVPVHAFVDGGFPSLELAVTECLIDLYGCPKNGNVNPRSALWRFTS